MSEGQAVVGAGLWSTTGLPAPLPPPPPPTPPPSTPPPPPISTLTADQPVTPSTLPRKSIVKLEKGHQPWAACCGSYCCICTECYNACNRCCCPCTWCRCCSWFWGIVFLVIAALGIAVGVFYKITNPKMPTFNISNAQFLSHVDGAVNTGADALTEPIIYTLNTETIFDMILGNPNTKIYIYYDVIAMTVKMIGMRIGKQVVPPFFMDVESSRDVNLDMPSGPIRLKQDDVNTLNAAQAAGRIPVSLLLHVEVRVGAGTLVKLVSPAITIELGCDATVAGSNFSDMRCKITFILGLIKYTMAM